MTDCRRFQVRYAPHFSHRDVRGALHRLCRQQPRRDDAADRFNAADAGPVRFAASTNDTRLGDTTR